MTALVSTINFLIVYLRYLVTIVFGGNFFVKDFINPEQKELARNIIIQVSNGVLENGITKSGNPLLLLFIGIFVIGAVIGLVKRLIRG